MKLINSENNKSLILFLKGDVSIYLLMGFNN